MKQQTLLLLIFTIIVATAGCTSQNTNQNTALNNGDTGQSQIQNSTPNSSETPNPGANSRYEATGLCYHVVDGDTIDVEGVGRIRLVGVNTPERGEPGYQSATDFVKSMVEGKVVGVDIDDYKHYDKYDRTLAVVYINGLNLNQELLKRGYAEVMYIPPSEFNPYSWA